MVSRFEKGLTPTLSLEFVDRWFRDLETGGLEQKNKKPPVIFSPGTTPQCWPSDGLSFLTKSPAD